MRGVIPLLAAVMLAACASQVPSDDTSPSEEPTATATESANGGAQPGDEELTGILGSEAVEGGCPYLRTEDGTQYEVLWPEGWQVDRRTLELTNPEGEVVARAGDSVTVLGRPAEDVASICMIGPIFGASEVVTQP